MGTHSSAGREIGCRNTPCAWLLCQTFAPRAQTPFRIPHTQVYPPPRISSEDIFPTIYRGNTREDIPSNGEGGAYEGKLSNAEGSCVFNLIAALAASELLVMRLLAQFQETCRGMIDVYRRSPVHLTCTGHDAQISARTAGGDQVGLR